MTSVEAEDTQYYMKKIAEHLNPESEENKEMNVKDFSNTVNQVQELV